jgi:ComF family protein
MGGVSWLAQCALDFLIDERCHACGAAIGAAPGGDSCPALAGPLDVFSAGAFRLKTRLLCAACAWQVRHWPGQMLLPSGRLGRDPLEPIPFFPVFVTDERLLVLIHLLKFGRRERIAAWLADAMAARLPDFSGRDGGRRIVVPVPMDRSARMRRGFNQAERIARELARQWSLPVAAAALGKIRRTKPQSTLGREERLVNPEGAFEADPAWVRGADVIVVDDLVTTGATVRACAGALRASGARRVVAVCAGYRDQAASAPGVLPQS